jgi:hypothetical protein
MIAILLAAMSSAAVATPAAKPKAPEPAPVMKGAAPNFDAMFGIFDKLFPALPDPDPARLALARTAVAAMWPNGSYGKAMSSMMGGIVDRAMQLKTSDFAAMSGMPAKKIGAIPNDASLHDQVAAKDPYFDQRIAAYRGLIGEETAKMSTVIDPRMRDGLARTMARQFDARQLADIDAFFATPSGRALAGQYMQLWFQPDTMRAMFTAMPEMMKLMPDAMQKMKAIDARYPKPAQPKGKDAKSN